ncbi:MAG: ABC transporter substrate-binding protein [Acidimicrobiaceae bacterium]|nr:ABC transporter substrate-binding protein [Acidimicrobiaceae bacterium]
MTLIFSAAMKHTSRLLAVVAAVGLVAAACSSSSKHSAGGGGSSGGGGSGGNTASAPGVTPTSVTVGMLTTLTGAGGSQDVNMPTGALARFALQNAEGGVNGRKVTMVVKDDQTSPTQDMTAAQLLIQQPVFGVLGVSPLLFASARTFNRAGLPVVGGGFDGQEWGQYNNMFTWAGAGSTAAGTDPHAPQWTTEAQFIKDQGGTNAAAFGYSISPSSSNAAKGLAKAAPVVGIKLGLLDTSIPFGTVNVAPLALQMKQKRVDAAELNMDANTNFAIITAARQAGVNLKVPLMATGYGQQLLNDPTTLAAAQNSYFLTICQPVESHTAATQAMQSAMAKYEHFTGVPDFGWCYGYVSADLMIKGLEMAGKNPTRKSFIDGLRTVTNYTAGGLLPQPANFSLSQFGKSPNTACSFFVKLEGKNFVPVPANGKPVCGTRIPNSNLS